MFFWWSKVLRIFLDPLFWALILLPWFWRGRKVWLLGWLAFWALSTPLCAELLLGHLEQLTPPEPLRKGPGYLVVLTGMLDLENSGEGPEFGAAADRILKASQWVQAGYGDHLLVVGGDGSLNPTGRSEAQILGDWLLEQGFPPDQLTLLPYSKNTWENALEVAQLTGSLGDTKLGLVTSAFHMYRARGAFLKAGLKTSAHPVDYRAHPNQQGFWAIWPKSAALAQTVWVFEEYVGILVYRLSGRADYSEQT
ncbi:MAG: hypothetical protein A2527_00440 [Candidatus Lambdaproteobacteria bacterium RIFOXYD2_FULL_50_16]|uniref:DUF218 domain-containing protein n=1 Tax=Candidatus Lambdaproteobacteria bacterium RIFOXYD2_FULL_50_16 TaxID=1817772 RepID=A0A1F6GFJ3_9PROT|nr:MAG: hypothetical protein A2527_00440 [Candidatus Lambdaproteobacteria bacterium RIFOXYD2_FULL_50_16]